MADEEDFLDESVLQGSGSGGSGTMSLGGAPGATAARGANSGRRAAAGGGGAGGSSASNQGDTRYGLYVANRRRYDCDRRLVE